MEENSNGNEEKLDSEVGEIRAENQEEAKVSPDEGKIATQNLEEDKVASENGEVTSEKIETTGGRVIEVPAKKIVLGGKVLTVSLRKDIDAVAGKKLTPEQIKERLIVAIKENGEKIIEDPTIDTPVGPPIVPPTEPTTEEKKKEEKEEKKVSKFKPKYLIPILIPVILALLAQACHSFGNRKPTVEEIHVPIDAIVYDIDAPQADLAGIVGIAGQEGQVNNMMVGDTFEGEHYSSNEHGEAETKAVSGVADYEDIKQEIDSYMAILTAKESTQEQRFEAAKRLLDIQQNLESVYKENIPLAQEYAQRFKDASEEYRDSNTDNESMAVDIMVEEYLSELGLSSANVAKLQEIVSLMEQGYELTIEDVQQELDGDYRITGEAVKEVVVKQDTEQAKNIWQKLVDLVKGRSDKEIENDRG